MGKTMSKTEMQEFVRKIGRAELYEELRERPGKNLNYFKGVQTTLVALGYDEAWVHTELTEAMYNEYCAGA